MIKMVKIVGKWLRWGKWAYFCENGEECDNGLDWAYLGENDVDSEKWR